MITVDHLTKRYGNVVAVDGLSFEVGPGRVTGFMLKTQAYSAYRKLGVSTRSEAVVRARELGLDAR